MQSDYLPEGCLETDIPGCSFSDTEYENFVSNKLEEVWEDFEFKTQKDAECEYDYNEEFRDFMVDRFIDSREGY